MLGFVLTPTLPPARTETQYLRNIFKVFCHYFCAAFAVVCWAQVGRPPYLPLPRTEPSSPSPNPNVKLRQPRPNAPPANEVRITAVTQEISGEWRYLRGNVEIDTVDINLRADELDYNTDTGDVEARGHVRYFSYAGGEEILADRAEYNVDEERGRFYNVHGTSPAKIQSRPGVLSSSNPYWFQGKWAERQHDRYILYDGFLTNCSVKRPMWILQAPKFDIIPGERALAYKALFRLKKIPLLYTPMFYKSLQKAPRKSGFLTPNIGNSSRRGKMVGVGYYWAINRSYDMMYRNQWFTERGFAHTVDFRGKPNQTSDFDFYLYGVNDKGLQTGDTVRKEGGFFTAFNGRTELGHGFSGRANINYLSSFRFRQAFTESFNEAIGSEVQASAYVTRHWDDSTLNFVFGRKENWLSPTNDDYKISIRRLPQVEYTTHDHPIENTVLPLWIALDASASLLHRQQEGLLPDNETILQYQTRQFVPRVDFAPRVMTAFHWKDIHIVPYFQLRETYYGVAQNLTYDQLGQPSVRIMNESLVRSSREMGMDLVFPSLEKIFNAPKKLGEKVKHVIEPRARFKYVDGVNDFQRLVRFDETELVADTKELEVSITNRFYLKRKDGENWEALTWQVTQRRYFDPTFGGAIENGQRTVLLSSIELTGYAFLDRPRNYSPIVSALRVSPVPGIGFEWRADYDPLRGGFTNSGFSADGRLGKYFLSLGQNQVRDSGKLSPPFNQFRGLFGFGNEQRRGWNGAVSVFYDFDKGQLQYTTTQITYNTDCCGFSVQYRRFSFGTRNENQFRVAFVVSNIGSFGTLKRQERIF